MAIQHGKQSVVSSQPAEAPGDPTASVKKISTSTCEISTREDPSDHVPFRPEILAPVGNWTMLTAAVENGADAIYFGIQTFNARLRAENFSIDDLPRIMSTLHQRGVKGYLTVNTLVFSSELDEARRLLVAASRAGVDAIIIQDLGLAYLASRIVPDLELHASTQMTLTSAESIKALGKLGLDFPRVVLARELSIREIGLMRKDRELVNELEVFVHGALCVAYSGQCLTSEALGGRSANRGECAQACRLPYEMVVDGESFDTGDRKYLLSPNDLAAYDDVKALIELGVRSFKIEGRLKSPEYVAATVSAYREAIEKASRAGEASALDSHTVHSLESTFSRGFTGGYLHKIDHQQVVDGRSSTKRGTLLGEVVGVGRNDIKVELIAPLKPGDGIVVEGAGSQDLELGGRVFSLNSNGSRIDAFEPRGGSRVVAIELHSSSQQGGRADLRRVRKGQRVFKTSDPAIERELRQSFSGTVPRFKQPVTIEVCGRPGAPLRIEMSDTEGRIVTVLDHAPAEAASERPLDDEVLKAQLGRLGDTPFRLERLHSAFEAPVHVPFSRLNELRRRCVAELLDLRAAAVERTERSSSIGEVRETLGGGARAAGESAPTLSVLCRTIEQVEAAIECGVQTIFTDFEDIRLHKAAREIIPRGTVRFVPATLRVIKPGEAATIRKLLQSEPDALLLRNLASWLVLRETAPELPFIGDYPLNVANQLTADLLLNAGFERLTPSYDLNFDQLSSLISQSDPSRFEVTVHQYMPMFHMEHCVFCRFLSSGTDSSNCGRPCESHEVRLRDRMGYEHPVIADFGCRNTVFNAVPQTAAAYLAGMRESGIFRFRLDLLLEDREEARTTISLYRSALGAGDDHLGDAVDPASLWRRLRATSKLGVTRGSLDHTGGAEERIASEEKLYRIGHRARAVEAVSRG